MPSPTPRPPARKLDIHHIKESSIFEQRSNFAIITPPTLSMIVTDLIWRDGDPPLDIEAQPEPFPLMLVTLDDRHVRG